ncbi:transcriptional regulator PpsR [Methylobacterium organophilum]|uniref:transcriptional regulator PpsR n=1 Tax=Methylobacterium organophilum TaxID=410 RepID=UPI001EE3311B|nr:transcriptional regulator PpsR [Methylobacterium organophilum]
MARSAPHQPSVALQLASGVLDGEAAGLLIAATTDLSLVVDAEGVIRETVIGSSELGDERIESWLGQRFVDTVTVESRPKIDALLRDAGSGAVTRWRQVNHPSPTGIDLPVRYATMRPKKDGPIVVIGRELRGVAALQRRLADAQQALERDYDRLRAAETRYKLLFQLSGEPVLVVDAGTRRVTEANPAALRLLGKAAKRVVGQDVVELFEAGSTREVQALFTGLRVTGQDSDLLARLGQGRGETRISASLFRGEKATSVLVRLSAPQGAAETENIGGQAFEVIRRMPEGFVVTDPARRILSANPAFVELVQLATEEQVRGQPLERWLGREGMESQALFETLREHGSVRRFSTVTRGTFGSVEDVEIAAVSVPGGERACLGFAIRPIPRRTVPAVHAGAREVPHSVEQMTELVGRVSMKTLVRETTDLIEKLCIEAALRITRDNRASAAEMLGLSRQGLYAKMRRYGIGDLDGSEIEA